MKSYVTLFSVLLAVLACTTMPLSAQVTGAVHYVSPSGGNTYPYTSWATAAHVIQDAVDACAPGGTVRVDDGTYDTGGALTPGSALMNRVVVDKAVTVESVNGPDVTTIVGEGPVGASAVRGVFLRNGAQLIGFTVTNGHSGVRGVSGVFNYNGGGVFVVGECVVSNCVVVGNHADNEGGGVYGIWGASRVTDCLIKGNHAGESGGGIRLSDAIGFTFQNCTVIENTARTGAGALFYHAGHLNNCLIARNRASNVAGGVYIDWGTYYGQGNTTLNNCTIVDNYAPSHGGFSYVINGAQVRNCIVYNNANGNWHGGWYEYTCTTPLPSGTGNISVDPMFVDAANGDYHLGPDSLCIDAGNNAYAQGPVDLDGDPRIDNGVVDMGAYEGRGIPPFRTMALITKIGFSNDPEGDQDVTEFLNDETLYIYVADVDLDATDPACSVFITVFQKKKWSDAKRSQKMRLTLDPQEDGSFTGAVPLDQLGVGMAEVQILANKKKGKEKLQRTGYIFINPAP